MKFIGGYKQQMTQAYKEDGTIVPVTVVKAEPCVVTQVKRVETDGYEAVQIGIGKKKKIGKSLIGHLGEVFKNQNHGFDKLREIRIQDASMFHVGDVINLQTFKQGDKVEVVGISKGKGFQGVVKRHKFAGQPASRGTKDQIRMPGSIASKRQGPVKPGQRMAGRMGSDRVKVKNLEVIAVDAENNSIMLKGALPGARNGFLLISGEGELSIASNMFKKEEKPVEAALAEAPKEETKS